MCVVPYKNIQSYVNKNQGKGNGIIVEKEMVRSRGTEKEGGVLRSAEQKEARVQEPLRRGGSIFLWPLCLRGLSPQLRSKSLKLQATLRTMKL